MKPRHRTIAGGRAPTEAMFGGQSPSGFFQIDARMGHAWFARSDRDKLPPGRERETLPVLRRAELVLAGKGRAVARRVRRVPAEAIVSLGASLACGRQEPMSAAVASVANDNVAYLSSRTRTLLRELAFFAIFGATLAGTYYLGRMHAFHNVIVVPDAASRANKVV